jgi:polyhydroxyalkanoate synthase
VTEDLSVDAPEFFRQAAVEPGSWWPDYSAWLAEGSGEEIPAPRSLGSRKHRSMARAPGTYVHAA